MLKKARPFISLALAVAAIAAGAIYIARHKYLLNQLSRTPLHVTIYIFLLYILMLGVLVAVFSASLKICRRPISWHENGLLNAHSLFINYFVPGQGGPAYRGLYLYRKHRLRVKNYIVVTLLYYAIYAVINVILLFAANRPAWQTLLAAAAAVGVSYAVIKYYSARARSHFDSLDLALPNIAALVLATLAQAIVQAAIYGVELHTVNGHLHFGQIVTYTGAADLALFVSLTPGAIGIRETFLIFTRHLHHITSGSIIIANVIDRSVYLVFLLALLALTAAYHIRKKEDPFKLI